jgi:transposase
LECSGCGRKFSDAYDSRERAVRDLPWSEFQATVHIEVYRVKCQDCGVRIEKVPLLPSKAPFSKRFEDAVGQACESASARQVARRMGLAESTVRGIDLRYLERWEAKRRQPPLRQMGVDEIYRGKKDKFLTVVCNLETGEPLWFGKERKKETLDEYFRTRLVSRQRKRIEAVCVDMWEPFRLSIEQWAPQCKIVYDKFHILQHANDAIDELRKAEFFRQGPKKRGLIKGKKWLLLSRWKNLTQAHRGELNRLFQLNRRVFKAYLLKESLERLWNYRYRGAMLNYLNQWMEQLKWQRLAPFEKLAKMLLKHVDGIANYCETKVRFGVVEAVNGNIRMLINRGRGYKNLRYLLLKAKRMAVMNVEFIAVRSMKQVA